MGARVRENQSEKYFQGCEIAFIFRTQAGIDPLWPEFTPPLS